MVPLGSLAPDFNLKGTDGQTHVLADYASAKALVIVFMCNHCPYVQKIWDDLVALEKKLREEFPVAGSANAGQVAQVQFLGVNSNANLEYPEDSFEKMQEYAAKHGQEFPYLYDGDQAAAKAYDAQCTPDIFVYDAERKLAYRGAFVGVEDAVRAIIRGEKPEKEQQQSMGCSIKWC